MKDVVQLQQLTGASQSTKKWRRGKSPKEEIRLGAVDRLRARLMAEEVRLPVPEPVFEPTPSKVVEAASADFIEISPTPAVQAAPVDFTFPDELLPSPAPVEETPVTEELPLEAPVEVVKPKKRRKFSETTDEPSQPAEPIVLELVDKAENTSVEAPQE
jgi:hypothetical protein